MLRTTWLGTFFALGVLALSTGSSGPGYEGAEAEQHLLAPCSTCNGEGRTQLPCTFCGPKGKAPCYDCGPIFAKWQSDRQMARMLLEDPEGASEVDEAYEKVMNLHEELTKSLGMNLAPPPGELPCPGKCAGGKSFLNQGFDCKVCKTKGSMKCPTCKGKGDVRCFACGNERVREASCPECMGSGTAPDPLSRNKEDAQVCPWCLGKERRPCADKVEEDPEGPCWPCGATGERTCRSCAGTERTTCNKCSGTGDLSSFYGAKSSNKCDQCKRKGTLPCQTCKGGSLPCERCAGSGKGKFECDLCYGGPLAWCQGCFDGASLSWRETGSRLLAAKRLETAEAYLEVALDREQIRQGKILDALADKPTERRARERSFAKELAPLRELLEQARQK